MNTKIRTAVLGDILALERVALRAYALYVPRMGRKPPPMRADFRKHMQDDLVFVWDEEEVCAYAVLIIKMGKALLDNIAVDPGKQGRRIGSELLAHVETHLRTMGFNMFELYTNEKMTENIAWYLRSGFVETGREEQEGVMRVFFEKNL